MIRLLFIFILFVPMPVLAQGTTPPGPLAEPPMTFERLAQIVFEIDDEVQISPPVMQLTVEDIPVTVIVDPRSDRMRAMVPIRSAEGIAAEELMRLMQANFDSALDARYAVAQGRLWGVYIHPLSPLEQDQFLSAIVQTINVARTYGQTYSGGAQVFGGGDSHDIYRGLLEKLRRKGEEL